MFAGVCAGLWRCLLGCQRSRVGTPNLAHKFQRNKVFLLRSLEIIYFVRILRARPPCSASYQQGPNLESCVWEAVSSHSSHHLQEVLLTQFSLYVHKGGLKPHLFYFTWSSVSRLPANNMLIVIHAHATWWLTESYRHWTASHHADLIWIPPQNWPVSDVMSIQFFLSQNLRLVSYVF